MKFKAYDLISRAVEEGSTYGVNWAFKHTDSPARDLIAVETEKAIMNALCDILDFEDETII